MRWEGRNHCVRGSMDLIRRWCGRVFIGNQLGGVNPQHGAFKAALRRSDGHICGRGLEAQSMLRQSVGKRQYENW